MSLQVALLRDYKLKLVALVFAIFIWFFVVTESSYEYVVEMPILTTNIQDGKVILNKFPAIAKVKIKGSGKGLIALGLGGDTSVRLDLSDVEKSRTFVLGPKNVFIARPLGIVADEVITPDSITLVLDDKLTKRLPVQAKMRPLTSPGYTIVGGVQLAPDSVDVTGPKSLVAPMDRVFTQEQELSDLKMDVRKIIPLAPPASDKIELSASQVEMYINVQKLLEITVHGVQIEVRNAPANLVVSVIPSTLDVVLEGGGDLLTNVSRDDIIAYIDYNRVKNFPGNEFLAVVDVPKGVSFRDVKPRTFKLVFERRQSQ
ncbi:MAG TPA: CdaR family protein [bacterium]